MKGTRKAALGTSVLLLAAPMVLAALAVPAVAPHVCDPHPVGRCGAFQRESVVHCYVLAGGQYLSPTDPHVVTIGGPAPDVVSLDKVAAGLLYVRLKPAETFAADPYEAPLPAKSLFRESNSLGGLQPSAYKCANFVWFAECEPMQWMGPFQVVNKAPDELLL